MTDLLDFTELFSETLARVRARLDADANAGLTEDDPAWIDIRQGSFYWDCTQPPAMEMARLWDAMTETAAAAFPSTAWGDYLDEHGTTFDLTRIPAAAATGELTFVATAVTMIAAGTQASSVASQTGDVITFQTTDSGTTCDQLAFPENITVDAADSGGLLSAGDRYYHVTSLNRFGETTGSADVPATTTSSAGRNTLTWDPVDGATSYRVYCATEPSSFGLLVGSTVATSFVDDGTVTPAGDQPRINTTSGITLPAQAMQTGTAGNVAAGAVTSLDTVLPDVYSVTNQERFIDGAEQESDEDFRIRILGEYQGSSGGGNVADYKRWVIGQGIARVSVIPVWDGPGTVLVVIMLADGSPYQVATINAIQAFLDPVAGQGAGQAPVGATVTVMTSALVQIDIVGQVIPVDGYSLDGTNNTIPTRNSILTSLSTYLNSLEPGGTVVYEHIQACFFVPGVFNIAGVAVNGSVDDLPLAAGTSANFVANGTFTGDALEMPPAYWSTAALMDWINDGAEAIVIDAPAAPNGRAVSVVTDDTADSEGIWTDLGILAVGTYTVQFAINAPAAAQISVAAGQDPTSVTIIDTGTGWTGYTTIQFQSDGTSNSYLALRTPTNVGLEFWLAGVSVRSVTVQVPRLGITTLTEPD